MSINALKSLIETSKLHNPTRDIPILAMSATFRLPEQRSFNAMMGQFPELVMWGDMNRRNVGIWVEIAGEPLTALINTWVQDVMRDPTMQSLIMSNSAAACDGRILICREGCRKIARPGERTDPKVFHALHW